MTSDFSTSNLSKIKPKLRTEGQVTGNWGRPKVKAGANTNLGLTHAGVQNITTQDDYLARMYRAYDTTTDPKVKAFCYQEIKKIMIQRGKW